MSITDETAPAVERPWRVRGLALIAAVALNLAAWLIADLAGAELVAATPGQDPEPIGAVDVAVATVAAGGLGWLARAVLDRIAGRRAAGIWLIGAAAVVAVGMVPLIAAEATTGTITMLAVTHLLVAIVLLPVLGRRLPSQRGENPS